MKKILIISLMVITFNVYALDGSDPSPTNSVTTVFTEAVDQYLDVIDFNLLDSSVLFLQFDSPTATDSMFSIGTGNSFSDFLYLGFNLVIKNPETESVDKSTSTSDIATASIGDGITGRADTLTTSNQEWKDGLYIANITAGLKLSAFTLGINGFAMYTESYDGNKSYTGNMTPSGAIGIYTAGFPTITAAESATSEVTTTTYNALGDVSKFEVSNQSDGYENSKALVFGLGAGTQLNVSSFILDVRTGISLYSIDDSSKADLKSYTTQYDSTFDSYSGVDNASIVDTTASEIVNINNQLGFNASVSTTLPLLKNFDLESGLSYTLTKPLYTDGGITSTYKDVSYTSTTDGVLITTTIDTNEINLKTDIDSINNIIEIPVTFTSNFNDAFSLAIRNTFALEIDVTEKTYSGSTIVTNEDNYSDSTTDTKIVTTQTLYGNTTSVTETTFSDTINAGAKFYLTDKVRINLGSEVTLTPYNKKVSTPTQTGTATEVEETLIDGSMQVTSTSNAIDVDSEEQKTTSDDSVTTTSVSYTAGLTYFLNENMLLDLEYTSAGDSNLWDLGNWSLMLTAKY